jgi:hypothetical protein
LLPATFITRVNSDLFLCLFTLWVLNCCHTISISCWKSALWSRTQNMVTFITARLASLALSLVSLYKSTRRHPLTIKCHWVERRVVLNVIRLLFLMKRKHLELVTNKRERCLVISIHMQHVIWFLAVLITYMLFTLRFFFLYWQIWISVRTLYNIWFHRHYNLAVYNFIIIIIRELNYYFLLLSQALFSVELLLSQLWTSPLRLQVSDCSTFLMLCDVLVQRFCLLLLL